MPNQKATIRKIVTRLNAGDVVHVLPIPQTGNHLLNWLGDDSGVQAKTVASLGDSRDPREVVVTFTDGTQSHESRNVMAHVVTDAEDEAEREAARAARAAKSSRAPIPVKLPVKLFDQLGLDGYGTDRISDRRRRLYAELRDARQRLIARRWFVTAELSSYVLASTLFDGLLDLWELRRPGASDLRRAALPVLAALQDAGVRESDVLPDSHAAAPIVSGLDHLRSLLDLS